MCSAALLCDTSWSANQEIPGSPLNSVHNESNKNAIDASSMNESIPETIVSGDASVITGVSLNGDANDNGIDESTNNVLQVARQDSGVPEDPASPCRDDPEAENRIEDPDRTADSDCNITVIHVTTDEGKMTIEGNDTNDFTVTQESRDTETSGRDFTPESKDSKDGSDSGVEGCVNELARVEYASSCNGLDEVSCGSSLVSCCSVYEDPCAIMADDPRMQSASIGGGGGAGGISGEGTSEGGSESSSLAGSCSGPRTTASKRGTFGTSSAGSVVATPLSKRKSDTRGGGGIECSAENSRTATSQRAKSRGISASATSRASSCSRNTPANSGSTRDRGRPREGRSITRQGNRLATPSVDNTPGRGTNVATRTVIPGNSAGGATPARSTGTRTRRLPDSLGCSSLTAEIDRDLAAQRGRNVKSVASKTRGACANTRPRATPASTPCDDSRKSSVGSIPSRNHYNFQRGDNETVMTTSSSHDERSLETYATLPRVKNRASLSLVRSVDRGDDLFGRIEGDRSGGKSREASLGRTNAARRTTRQPASRESISVRKCLPPCPRTRSGEKTRIYHEVGVQTGLTGPDMENVLAGVEIRRHDPASVERLDIDTQTEETWEDVERIKAQLCTVTADVNRLRRENEKLERSLADERADHAFARQELDSNARRVVALLGTRDSDHDETSDSLLELESHFQSSGQVVASQQIEIADLQSLCRMLNRDLEKSLAVRKSLIQQQQELEAESTEMEDFLQAEKATLAEALKDAEAEIARKNHLLTQRDIELARLTEECKHLVRMSEQRRQENLSLCMKLNAVERRSKELILGQGAAVSGAAVALSGLGTRLEGLADQLVRSYKISEKDLEDVVYHNEAYSRSNSSAESSPISSKQASLKECTPSPKRGSFVSAVIGAIRNAATHPFAMRTTSDDKPSPIDASKYIFKEMSSESSSDLLDFETEPCLMMESVLEDVPLPDTYTHNMVSSSDSLRRALSVPEPIDDTNARLPSLNDGECTSLTNLTQAILNRRKVEDEEEVGGIECDSQSGSDGCCTETNSTAAIADYCPTVNLVDQVIDVDNLVTKLLKVLRIIQLDNDTCIRDLRDDKSELETKLEARHGELEELRKVAGRILDSDEIFADAVDHRRRTVVENRPESIERVTTGENPIQDV